MEQKIIYEDEYLLVVDKPYGTTVNRSDTTKGEKTLQDWVEEYLRVPRVSRVPKVLREEKALDAPGTLGTRDTFLDRAGPPATHAFALRAGIVHRLDKETSGILLVAKTKDAFENLQKQFKERIVKKVYTALAHGKVLPEVGEIKVPVGRLPWNRKRFGVVLDGRESLTRYKVIKNYSLPARNASPAGQRLALSGRQSDAGGNSNLYTLLELYPETGRTHQIRVHLKYINHPIFADYLYAGRKTSRDDRKFLPRVFLHASKISFQHPSSGEVVSFESPLPKELKEFLDGLLPAGV